MQFEKEKGAGTNPFAELSRDFSRELDSPEKTKWYWAVAEDNIYSIQFRTLAFTSNVHVSVSFQTQNELRATSKIASRLERCRFTCLQLRADIDLTTCTTAKIIGRQYSFFHRSGIGFQVYCWNYLGDTFEVVEGIRQKDFRYMKDRKTVTVEFRGCHSEH